MRVGERPLLSGIDGSSWRSLRRDASCDRVRPGSFRSRSHHRVGDVVDGRIRPPRACRFCRAHCSCRRPAAPDGGSGRRCSRTGCRSRGAGGRRPPGPTAPPPASRSRRTAAAASPTRPRLRVQGGLRVESPEPLLIVAHPIRIGRLRGWRRRARRGRGGRIAGQEDDEQHPDRQRHHQPRLYAPRQHAARHRSAIDDGRGSWGTWLIGHDYRSRCSNVSRALPKRQVAAVEHLRHDVGAAALHLEVHDRRLAVLQLVESGQFRRVGLQVRELAVVPDRPHEERLLVLRQCRRRTAGASGYCWRSSATVSVARCSARSAAFLASVSLALQPLDLGRAVVLLRTGRRRVAALT